MQLSSMNLHLLQVRFFTYKELLCGLVSLLQGFSKTAMTLEQQAHEPQDIELHELFSLQDNFLCPNWVDF